MRKLERKNPDLVKVFSIGQTFDGRDTLVAKLGKAQNYQKPAIFLEGGACSICIYFILYLDVRLIKSTSWVRTRSYSSCNAIEESALRCFEHFSIRMIDMRLGK